MTKLSVETGNGKVAVSAKPAERGPGLAIIHAPEGQAAPDSVTITCSCENNGTWYSTTATCSRDGWCDCSNPTSPRVVCT